MEWKASHILVNDKGLAEAILKRLKSGGVFETLAREFSRCPSKSKGGDLGWFSEGQMVKPFEEAVKKGGKGRILGPVKTRFGYHIIRKTDER